MSDHQHTSWMWTRRLNVVLIDDCATDLFLVERNIRESDSHLTVHSGSSLADCESLASGAKIDVILLDLDLVESTGLDTFERFSDRFENIPIVILTGNSDQELGLHIIEAGAQDFFHKEDVNGVALVRCLRHAAQRHQLQSQLLRSSITDSLTGLPNRLAFESELETEFRLGQEGGHSFAVGFIDLNEFKLINDCFGHPVGDYVLKTVGCRLREGLNNSVCLARFGGDEFVLLVRNASTLKHIEESANSLKDLFRDPIIIDGTEHHLEFSIGYAVFSEVYNHPDELLRDADTAMYEAKREGKSLYKIFSSLMRNETLKNAGLMSDLRGAIQRSEFELFYQPIVDLKSGRVKKLEALLRWHHPTLGVISPGSFIPLAEKSRMIVPIGMWVLESALKMSATLNRQDAVTIAVNISQVQVSRTSFVDELLQILEATGANPKRIELEITESVLMVDPDHVAAAFKELKSHGFRFAIDDFGTGYSSLSQLHRFRFDSIKIDRAFVDDIVSDPYSQALIRSVVCLGDAIHAEVTAEGVETKEQYRLLTEYGCDTAQGYWIGRPCRKVALGDLITHSLVID